MESQLLEDETQLQSEKEDDPVKNTRFRLHGSWQHQRVLHLN